MSDRIVLEIDGKRISHFLSYTVEADLYVADHAFSLEIGNPEFDIQPGRECRLYVNDQLELTGIIDRRVRKTDKQGRRMTIEGRDLMGLLVDSCCEQFITVQGKKLSELAELLLKNVPFIDKKKILYQQDLVGKLKTRRKRRSAGYGLDAIISGGESPERIAQIHPGMTIFQVLSMYAMSKGQMFFSLPDGTFVFGRPLVGGEPEYHLIHNTTGTSNVLMAEEDTNLSRRFSKVTIVGQRQGYASDGANAAAGNVSGAVTDAGFPFYKPFVQLSYNDSQTPDQHARLLLERMHHDGYRLTYELPRHSQSGRNFTINRLARVKDDVLGIDGMFLISGRKFRLDRDGGPVTALILSPPGLVQEGGKIGGGRR